jgi:hypothetical protein
MSGWTLSPKRGERHGQPERQEGQGRVQVDQRRQLPASGAGGLLLPCCGNSCPLKNLEKRQIGQHFFNELS